MKILMAASEMAPFAGEGGLADAVLALSGELKARGHEVSVALPYYRIIRENRSLRVRKTGVRFAVPMGQGRYPCEIFETKAPNGVQVFLVGRDEFFDRSGLYGADGRDYEDNAARFIFFSKCVVDLARRADPTPEIVHAADWQTAIIPALIRDQRLPFSSVLSIHSLAYQGNFWSYDFGLTNLGGEYFSASGLEFYGSMNLLKGGVMFARAIVLPGDLAVGEALTPEGGCGMDAVLRENARKIVGIPPGIPEPEWDPAIDPNLPATFSVSKPAGKSACRKALLASAGLAPDPAGPVIALAGTPEKLAMESLLPALDRILDPDTRLVFMGSAEAGQSAALDLARRRHPAKFAWLRDRAPEELHLLLAGSDLILSPGRPEAGGETLRRALRYGAVPVSMACGGLYQIVRDHDASDSSGNGFIFYSSAPDALVDAVRRAARLFAQPSAWLEIRSRGMGADVSWGNAAALTERLYASLADRSFADR